MTAPTHFQVYRRAVWFELINREIHFASLRVRFGQPLFDHLPRLFRPPRPGKENKNHRPL